MSTATRWKQLGTIKALPCMSVKIWTHHGGRGGWNKKCCIAYCSPILARAERFQDAADCRLCAAQVEDSQHMNLAGSWTQPTCHWAPAALVKTSG